jgi:hypothetical protein
MHVRHMSESREISANTQSKNPKGKHDLGKEGVARDILLTWILNRSSVWLCVDDAKRYVCSTDNFTITLNMDIICIHLILAFEYWY